MIKKITLDDVASFKKPTTLETDKPVNLIYGLNGTGKTTLSNYLYAKADRDFSKCTIEGLGEEEILVYNQQFIKNNFYEKDDLPGIFTLAKENKEAVIKIQQAEGEKLRLTETKNAKNQEIQKLETDINEKEKRAIDEIWEIKNIADRNLILNFCIKNLGGRKKTLFEYCIDLEKTKEKPVKNIEDLKSEAEALKGENAQKYEEAIPSITFSHEIEENSLFQKAIIGNEDSTVAELINKLGNSDWVKAGVGYLSKEMTNAAESCPFCQEKTITQDFIENVKKFFDKTYENDLKELKELSSNYQNIVNTIPAKAKYENNPFIIDKKFKFENLYNAALKILEDNQRAIKRKVKNPSQKIQLENSKEAIDKLNKFLIDRDQERQDHNEKIDNKTQSLEQIKNNFWEIMRWDYDQTISRYNADKKDAGVAMQEIERKINDINNQINERKETIKEQQKNTLNIQDAIANINKELTDFGLADFEIRCHEESNFYRIDRIVRKEATKEIFRTLSEGEKMIISFLYFIELCKGKTSRTDTGQKKIVVIDDPISSLSHIYIFNISELIKREFTEGDALKYDKYEQIFILTHSLYFFHELINNRGYGKKKKKKNFFRMTKNKEGSQILEMKRSEIQSDYDSYWQIIQDKQSQYRALRANCMRSIIEYFFGFIEKEVIKQVFQKEGKLQDNKYQAFYRYINRESHLLPQNIFDTGEFNDDALGDVFCLVFKETGYINHYNKMIKQSTQQNSP